MTTSASPEDFDSREVYCVNGELEGYALVEIGWGRRPLTPTRCCRTCAWADIERVRYVPGEGYRYFPAD